MHESAIDTRRRYCRLTAGLFSGMLAVAAQSASLVSGHVFDINGRPLHQAMVSVTAGPEHAGADIVSVFTDARGGFSFPAPIAGLRRSDPVLTARLLGYEQLQRTATRVAVEQADEALEVTIVMRGTLDQAAVAPASAWLASVTDPEQKSKLIVSCVGCHQVPAPEVRAYAAAIADIKAPDPAAAREQSWQAIVKYMNFLSAEEFGRGQLNAQPPDASRAYSVGNGADIAALLSAHFTGRMDHIQNYDYGAPVVATPKTVIREYEIPRPNAVREALLLGRPAKLWVADVNANRIISIDIANGEQRDFEVPSPVVMAPHTLHRGADGSLWVAPFFNAIVAHFDPVEEVWKDVWQLRTDDADLIGIHDLSFGYTHDLLEDRHGRIWYSDIINNAVGYFDPNTSAAEIYRVPEVPGRPGARATLYGLAMTSDRVHIWYSQLGIGSFGAFNTETLEFETSVQLPSMYAGPRRLAVSDEDILYVPLYGAGQLIEYDTKALKQIGIYDLPDRASAPYAVTWDPVRKVVWIPTSNADVIYRFDPRTKQFGVLPLPRARAFLRMLGVDPETGMLATSYANIIEDVHGPRMALTIDPGDDAYLVGAGRRRGADRDQKIARAK